MVEVAVLQLWGDRPKNKNWNHTDVDRAQKCEERESLMFFSHWINHLGITLNLFYNKFILLYYILYLYNKKLYNKIILFFYIIKPL